MKFFIDSADISEILALNETGLIDGVTTNPSLIAKTGKDFIFVIKEIAKVVNGPVSAEVLSVEYDQMFKEAMFLAKLADNIVVKIPLTWDGLKLCKKLSSENINTNVTLCFSASQALLAAKAGATYISPFVGRLDDISSFGMELISDIREIYDNYDFSTEILVASVRNPTHIVEAARIGADVATVPSKLLWQLLDHPLTDKGLAQFVSDAKKSGLKLTLED